MQRAIPLFFLGLALLTFTPPVSAQIKSHADVCMAGTGKFELDISFCGLAIRSGKHLGLSLATLHAQRGRARLELGDQSGAIDDFNTALTLNPGSALAHNERGRAYHKAGKNERAITDYAAALGLFPRYAAAFRNRGTAHIFTGKLEDAHRDLSAAVEGANYNPASRILRGIVQYFKDEFEGAIPDLSAAISLAYPYPEAVLWIYLAERQAGREGKAALARNAQEMSEESWPDALIDVYLGEKSPQSALDAAAHPRADIQRRRLTQAQFFLGELALLKGNKATARKRFEAVLNLGKVDAIEYAGAKLELHRMGR